MKHYDYQKAHEYYIKNRARILEQVKANTAAKKEQIKQYRSTPEFLAAHAESERRFRRKHADRLRAKNRERYKRNAESFKAMVVAYRKANPERVRQWQRVTNHRRRSAEGSFTQAEWRALLDAHGHRCAICGIHESESIHLYRKTGPLIGRLTIDHLVPISKGGSNYITNIQPTCLPCNLKKRNYVA